MPDTTSRFLTALGRVIRSLAGSGRGRGPDVATPRRTETDDESWPGKSGRTATVELDPRRIGKVRSSYTPERDGEPDPGEVVWTWVPYEERDGRGKDRPVVIVAAGAPGEYLAVQLTSTDLDHDPDGLALGAGPWDSQGRPSWARLDRVFLVHAGGMRREAALLDRTRYTRLVEALEDRYGWGSAA